MSIARHHNEWLSLLEISGPFLSLPVLLRVFPQGLDAHDTESARSLRLAFEEWEETNTDRAIHNAWVGYVLRTALEYPDEYLLSGQNLSPNLEARAAEHNEILRPGFAMKAPQEAQPRLLVSVYPPQQALDKPVPGTSWKAAPETRMMALLLATGVPLGLVTNGERWMLVCAQRDQTTTYVEWRASLWSEEPLTLRAFRALLGVRRFLGVAENETLAAMLAESLENQQEVTDQLGRQVRTAVEVLIRALDRINIDQQGHLLDGVDEKSLYEAALTVMMRLVFLFSAEERGLLRLGDPLYDRHYAISTLRDQLREVADAQGEQILERRHDAWSRLLATFRVIFGGVEHEALQLPAYGGALFDPDRFPFIEGRSRGSSWETTPASPLAVNNRTVLHLLEALQFLQIRVPGDGTEARRLSFRALDIEQIGHVYEGLLDHIAVRARAPMLGLIGTQGADPEIALERLEAKAAEGEAVLVELLRDATGRSASALRRALSRTEPPNAMLLRVACSNETALYDRVAPFAHLLRDDTHGVPVVILPGGVFITAGADRRSTSTHYTQRILTEPLVKTTLDPLLYRDFDTGVEPAPQRLRPVEEILRLRVCDLACGSGAILVQACRYLAERVVEAWGIAEQQSGNKALVIPEASAAAGHPAEQLLPRDDEERLAIARRLVAERCLYGVDVNPMAVEMAKLSLWLVTLHKHRPFTFLDHAIKCGDSLIGVHTAEQVAAFHLRPERAQARGGIFDYVTAHGTQLLERARQKREQLERFTVLDIRDAEYKSKLHREAEAALAEVRLVCDLIVGAGLATAGSNESRSLNLLDAKLNELVLHVADAFLPAQQLRAAEPDLGELQMLADQLLRAPGSEKVRRPFHWLVEFPEVFLHTDNPGFDALVGNPPFVGGQKITGLFGTDYRDFQVLHTADGRRGSADLCAYFFLRAGRLLKSGGNFGLLAVNTIAEGDTRQAGLEPMLRGGYAIYAAWPNRPWPGAAAVVVSHVHVHRGAWQGAFTLNGARVPTISAFLSDQDEWSPKPLKANANKSFQGSIVLGLGFTMSEEQAREFIARDAKNAEALFPYLNGEDLNSHPEQKPSRWVINFWDWPLDRDAEGAWDGAREEQQTAWLRDGHVPSDYPGRVATDFPELLAIVRELVKPERDRNTRRERREKWWHFAEKCPALYHAIGRGHSFTRHPAGWTPNSLPHERVLINARVSRYFNPSLYSNGVVFHEKIVVLLGNSFSEFAYMNSSLVQAWTWNQSSTMKMDLNFSPSDAYETLPRPTNLPQTLEIAGEQYFLNRVAFMSEESVGLTTTYNRFHDSQCTDQRIANLRNLHRSIDEAVFNAYGWSNVAVNHGFHAVPYLPENDRVRYTICEEARLEILRRLSRLNRERYEEEQRRAEAEHQAQSMLQPPRARRGKKPRLDVIQGGLF